MPFDLDFPLANQSTLAEGCYRSVPEDFYVEELMSPQLLDKGEHVWLWLEKRGQNTAYVAKQLAQFAGVREMDVGFAGLKDRHAVTRQWFSVYLGNRPEPDWSVANIEGSELLSWNRHQRKLRRGEHEGNAFTLNIRSLAEKESLEAALQRVQEQGFPNYFGEQRFGRDGANLYRGEQFFLGQIKASKAQRSFFLSAARSFLFNLNVARKVSDKTWSEDDASGPLYGDVGSADKALSSEEEAILGQYPTFAEAIHRNRLKLERRPLKIIPKSMSWVLEPDMLSVKFTLPTGVFATSLLRELGRFKDAAQ